MMMTNARDDLDNSNESRNIRDDDTCRRGGERRAVVYEAWLAGPGPARGGAKATVEADSQGGELVTKFEVEVEEAMPSGGYQVSVDGVSVGQLSTDWRGNARLTLSSVSESPDGTVGFPSIRTDSVVTVGHILRGRLFATDFD